MAVALDGGDIIAPRPEENEADAAGQRSRDAIAREVLDMHRAGLEARRADDMVAEKLLLHLDGSGDNQWADILDGTKVSIPRFVSEYRKQENLLRPIVDNAISHHTTLDLRFVAHAAPDRRSKERALMDEVWANNLAIEQDWLSLFADAMYLAMPARFCPVHAYWREDVPQDWYEPIEYGAAYKFHDDPFQQEAPTQGMIDCWVGNPFDTVFNRGAKRNSVMWASYGRMVNADMARRAFEHIPGAAKMEGSTRIPSAAEFQQIARSWRLADLGRHGTSVVGDRNDEHDELIYIICQEVAPGVMPEWPQGRLRIIGVPGAYDIRNASSQGKPILLADQSLPAADFSWSLFYSHHRGSDVHGKAWIEDLDQLQVDLNIALSKRWEHVNKMAEAPIVAPGGALDDDMLQMGGYNIMEIEASLAGWRPRVMEWPQAVLLALDNEISEKRRALYTIGGYQAVSRGESPGSRMAYRAIVALQQADNTVHGPVHRRYRHAATTFARRCWSQMKAYGDVPWMLRNMGDEYAHLVEPYIDNTQLSDAPPRYLLVNSFGASPEVRAQELLQLIGVQGADGQPFLMTQTARRHWPDRYIFHDDIDPGAVQRRRAKTVAQAILATAREFRQMAEIESGELWDPEVQQGGEWVFRTLESRFPRLRDDDLGAMIAAMTELIQDDNVDPIARIAAMQRQDLVYQQMSAMGPTMGPTPGGGPPPGGGAPPGGGGDVEADPVNRQQIEAEFMGGGDGGVGTTLDQAEPSSPLLSLTGR
jgi:hypothetical protein